MSDHMWRAVDDYFTQTLVKPDAALSSALARNAAAGLPPIDVAANQGKLLYLLARMMNASRILEIGTLGGYSTLWLARAAGGRQNRHAGVFAAACAGGAREFCRGGRDGQS